MAKQMTRIELESHVSDCLSQGKPYVFLEMEGDPNATKQRLIGHRKGPYGYVVGYNGPRCCFNVVMFDAERLQEYLDSLPVDIVSGDEKLPLHVSDSEAAKAKYVWSRQ